MDVADQIVVMNHGRVEQIGSPRDLYERPANEFVMTFVGPVSRLGDGYARPHDLELLSEPEEGATPVRVVGVVHLGFEVRVELRTHEGEELIVQLTREEADRLELRAGVYVRAKDLRVFVR